MYANKINGEFPNNALKILETDHINIPNLLGALKEKISGHIFKSDYIFQTNNKKPKTNILPEHASLVTKRYVQY